MFIIKGATGLKAPFSANGAILLPRGLMIPLKSDVDTQKRAENPHFLKIPASMQKMCIFFKKMLTNN